MTNKPALSPTEQELMDKVMALELLSEEEAIKFVLRSSQATLDKLASRTGAEVNETKLQGNITVRTVATKTETVKPKPAKKAAKPNFIAWTKNRKETK
jgi:hypothetical protein